MWRADYSDCTNQAFINFQTATGQCQGQITQNWPNQTIINNKFSFIPSLYSCSWVIPNYLHSESKVFFTFWDRQLKRRHDNQSCDLSHGMSFNSCIYLLSFVKRFWKQHFYMYKYNKQTSVLHLKCAEVLSKSTNLANICPMQSMFKNLNSKFQYDLS